MIVKKIANNIINTAKYSVERQIKRTGEKAVLIVSSDRTALLDYELVRFIATKNMPIYLLGKDIAELTEKLATQSISVNSVVVDLANAEDLKLAFKRIENEGCYADLVIYNTPQAEPVGFLDITEATVHSAWKDDCLSSFYVAQQALNHMLPRGSGTLIFGGASSSRQGKRGDVLNATTKAGLRLMTQSIAREFSSKGIHVIHAVLDDNTSKLAAGAANTYWQLYKQHVTTWTHEIDLSNTQPLRFNSPNPDATRVMTDFLS